MRKKRDWDKVDWIFAVVIGVLCSLFVVCVIGFGIAMTKALQEPSYSDWAQKCVAAGDRVVPIYRSALCVRPDGRLEMGQP